MTEYKDPAPDCPEEFLREKKKESFWGNLKWKLFMLKIGWELRFNESYDKRMRRKYCRKGLHKIRNHTYTYQEGNKRKVVIRAIKCDYCNYMFFAKKSDKEKYKQMEDGATERFSALFNNLSSAKSKGHSSVGGLKNKELSACKSSIKKNVIKK